MFVATPSGKHVFLPLPPIMVFTPEFSWKLEREREMRKREKKAADKDHGG